MSWAVCVLWGTFFYLLCLYFALARSVLIHLTVLQDNVHIDWSVLQDPQASYWIHFHYIYFIFANVNTLTDGIKVNISKWWEKHSPWSNAGNFVTADEASHEDRSLTVDLAVKECLWKGRHAISAISSTEKKACKENAQKCQKCLCTLRKINLGGFPGVA